MYRHYGKRMFDIIAALLLLVLLLPVLLVIMILISIQDGDPFFVQKRPGLHGKIFNIIKFRTMNNKQEINGELLPDVARMTPLGRLIRKTSLDEIPQLINVLKGDMSLVGPRPLLVEYLPLYNQEQRRRHSVRPGITGWAQVNGRNAITWEQKFMYDVWYADHTGLSLDMKILWLTVAKIFRPKDVNTSPTITMEKFKGHINEP